MSLDGLLGMLEARTVEEGRRCLGRLCNSSWNWLLADVEGNIGYQMAGKMPIRPEGISGLVPLAGWDPANDWRGFAALDDLPQASNPPEGFLVTANNDLNALGRVHPINLCVAPYRADRIREHLARPGRFTVEQMQAIQLDVTSIQAERFMALVRPLLADWPDNQNARLLRDWDLAYRVDSPGAFVFEQFYRELLLEVFGGSAACGAGERSHFGHPVLSHLLDETTTLAEYYGAFDAVLVSERSLWFGQCSREEFYRRALDRALRVPAEPLGRQQRFSLTHLLFGEKLPRWLGFDRGPVPLQGGRATVHQGQILRGRGRQIVCGPSYRFVTDLATDALWSTLPGGPSDRRFSPWYASGLLDWLKGRYHALRGWPAGRPAPVSAAEPTAVAPAPGP
jgi:penicillin amidase